MPSIDIVLDLSAAQCRSYYAGQADNIRTMSTDGRAVRLPAQAMHRIVDRDGVRGIYRLAYDGQGRFQSIKKLAPL